MIKVKVSDLMGKKKMTITKLIEISGLSRRSISALYHEKVSRVDFDTLEKLCKAFNCKLEDLIEYIPDEQSN